MKKTHLFLIVLLCSLLLSNRSEAQTQSATSNIWKQVGPYNGAITCYSFATSSDGKIFIGTDYGVYMSTDNGTTWALPGSPTTTVYVNYYGGGSPLVTSGKNLFALANLDIYQSTDDGTSWKRVSSPDTTTVNCLAVSRGNLLAGTQKGVVYSSTDNGTSWNQCLATGTAVYSIATSGSKIAVGTFWSGIYKSADNGINWTCMAIPFNVQIDNQPGLVWTAIPSLAFTTTGLIAGTNGSVLFTSNNGANWGYKVMTGISWPVQAFAISEDKIFAGADSGGVYQSTDDGISWTSVDSVDLGNHNVNGLLISGNYLLAATDSGIYRKQIDIIATGVTNKDGQVAHFELDQNYPNPFNPTTTINFTLGASSNVRLEVYNLLGQKVATIANGLLLAGSHTYQFDASKLASGIYIYRLEAGHFIETKKMILMK